MVSAVQLPLSPGAFLPPAVLGALPGSGGVKPCLNQVITFMTHQMHPCALEMAEQLAPSAEGVWGFMEEFVAAKIYGLPSGKEHTLLPGCRCLRSTLQKGLHVFLQTGDRALPAAATSQRWGIGACGAALLCLTGSRHVFMTLCKRELAMRVSVQYGGVCIQERRCQTAVTPACTQAGKGRQCQSLSVSFLLCLLNYSALLGRKHWDPNSYTMHKLRRGSMLAGLLPEPEVIGKGLSPHALSLAISRFG